MKNKLLVSGFLVFSQIGFAQINFLNLSGLTLNQPVDNKVIGPNGFSFSAEVTGSSHIDPLVDADGNISLQTNKGQEQCLSLSFSDKVNIYITDNVLESHGKLESSDSLTFNNVTYRLTDPLAKLKVSRKGQDMSQVRIDDDISGYKDWNLTYLRVQNLEVCGLDKQQNQNTLSAIPVRIGVMPSNPSIEWLDFIARVSGNEVLLNWSTLYEANSERFVIERTRDGRRWEQLGEIAAGGNTEAISQYYFKDASPLTGKSFYQIKQMDSAGNISYSAMQSVEFNATEQGEVYPNPFVDFVRIKVSNETRIGPEVLVYDALGNLVHHESGLEASTFLRLDLNHLQAGLYTILYGDKVQKVLKN
ncbi:MAG: T9SS type A sorting domain-containing protein [Saprospiraceae bacterium]